MCIRDRDNNKPIKTKRYFKVVIWNKGNSNFNSESDKFFAIKTEILNQDGDLVILSEAEFNPIDEEHIRGEFSNYDIYFKVTPGAIKARIVVLVKKDTINITRILALNKMKQLVCGLRSKLKTKILYWQHGTGNGTIQLL